MNPSHHSFARRAAGAASLALAIGLGLGTPAPACAHQQVYPATAGSTGIHHAGYGRRADATADRHDHYVSSPDRAGHARAATHGYGAYGDAPRAASAGQPRPAAAGNPRPYQPAGSDRYGATAQAPARTDAAEQRQERYTPNPGRNHGTHPSGYGAYPQAQGAGAAYSTSPASVRPASGKPQAIGPRHGKAMREPCSSTGKHC